MPGERKSIRLRDYDYRQAGAYYVMVCVNNRRCLFGDVGNGEMILNDAGEMVQRVWNEIPRFYDGIDIDYFQIMPNHLHGIIIIVGKHDVGAPLVGALNNNNNVNGLNYNRAGTRPAPTLGEIIGAFKSITTNEYIRKVKSNNWPRFNNRLWQRNFYEHVIRDELGLARIRKYIINNPAQWQEDEYYTQL
jgi:putative transposase